MATKKFPQRNVVMPMNPEDVAAARAGRFPVSRSAPGESYRPADGKGSKREVRRGEWVDDRVIDPHTVTKFAGSGTPPPLPEGREVPASFDPALVYEVTFGSAVPYLGRVLSPAKLYSMNGAVCALPTIQPAIVNAVELGPIPGPPAKQAAKATAKKA
jgi:hypothetical protein